MTSDQEKQSNKEQELEIVTLATNRVTKVVKGGKRMKFQALVVAGDRNGRVSVALAKGRDLKSAIEKASTKAKKSLKKIVLNGNTIPFEVIQKFKGAKIFFKPARQGTGIICSNAIRPIIELAGIKDIYTKVYGTNNKITNAYCVMQALSKFK